MTGRHRRVFVGIPPQRQLYKLNPAFSPIPLDVCVGEHVRIADEQVPEFIGYVRGCASRIHAVKETQQ